MRKSWALLILILGVSSLQTGCHHTNEDHSIESRIEWGYQQIDQHQYTEAIQTFWNVLRREDSETARLGLASAYAARAGILVENYWDLIVPSLQKAPPREQEIFNSNIQNQYKETLGSLPPAVQAGIITKAPELEKSYREFQTLRHRYLDIPLLKTPEEVRDIYVARNILGNVKSKNARLYRSLFSLILFRYESEALFISFKELSQSKDIKNNQKPCKGGLSQWVREWKKPMVLMDDFIVDIKVAFPQKQIEIEHFESEFKTKKTEILSSEQSLEGLLCMNIKL